MFGIVTNEILLNVVNMISQVLNVVSGLIVLCLTVLKSGVVA